MKIYLKNSSGLDMVFDWDNNTIEFEEKKIKPEIRKISDMDCVLCDSECLDKVNPDKLLYLMFRDICKKEDRENIEKSHLRYDVTVIFPQMIGKEFPKTKGHYHPIVNGSDVTYPEIYEVLHGEAHYLMQKIDKKGNVLDVYMVKASVGDKVIIPPGYGHITINPVNDVLIMANWVDRDFESDYGPIIKNGGGAYFEIKKDDRTEIIKNEKYSAVPSLRIVKATSPKFLDIEADMPMYKLVKNLDILRFLVSPKDYGSLFKHVF